MAWARDSLPPAIYTFIVLNTLAVGLRVFVRSCMSKSFGYDDYAMVVAYVRTWNRPSRIRHIMLMCMCVVRIYHTLWVDVDVFGVWLW